MVFTGLPSGCGRGSGGMRLRFYRFLAWPAGSPVPAASLLTARRQPGPPSRALMRWTLPVSIRSALHSVEATSPIARSSFREDVEPKQLGKGGREAAMPEYVGTRLGATRSLTLHGLSLPLISPFVDCPSCCHPKPRQPEIAMPPLLSSTGKAGRRRRGACRGPTDRCRHHRQCRRNHQSHKKRGGCRDPAD